MSAWWGRVPSLGKLWLGLIAAIFGTLVSISAAWPMVEPFMPSVRGWVRDHVAERDAKTRASVEPMRIAVIETQIIIKHSRRAQIEDRLITLEIEVAKSTNPEEVIRKRFQIRSLEEERTELDKDVADLRKQRDRN